MFPLTFLPGTRDYHINSFIEAVEVEPLVGGQKPVGKTFICFALSNGIPPDVVMKFTGHCDYKSMKPYITEDAKKAAIRKMEEAWKKK